ncbi:sulfite exporter TauE/SafE family protein [Candidatus Uhrbacteria bacterium]|nr:sulfite exporter TauE/SafE family protein [Candidatus Uhrbacteria bacterium]
MPVHLIIPAFIAGLLTFLAPCTLPLVPAYLGFISGASAKDLQDPKNLPRIRASVMRNGIFYVLGFSVVFVLLGVLFGIAGATLAHFEQVLIKVGGVFVIFFGLYLMHALDRVKALHFLARDYRFLPLRSLTPGRPLSSFIFGATFAFGWTPCVGPILGSILLLATTTQTALAGAFLLIVFSVGLAVPFLILAYGIGHASQAIHHLNKLLPLVSLIGGILLVFLGILLLTGHLAVWLMWMYRTFGFLRYERLLDYL